MTQAVPARRAPSRSDNGGPPGVGGRYGLLLLMLIASYLLSAFSFSKVAGPTQVGLFAAVLLLAVRTSRVGRQRARLFAAVALTGSAAALGLALSGTQTGVGVSEIWKGLILLGTAVLIVRRVLARPTVTVQSIYGALSAYLIIGLMFAAFYAAMEHLGGAPFFANGKTASTQTFQYFSFTTLTTLGYGDFTAAGNAGRSIAVMEALAGQVFLATLVARLVAAFRVPAEPTRPVMTRRWPPRAARRPPTIFYRGKRAGHASRNSARAPRIPAAPTFAARRRSVEDQAPHRGR
jgi:Ion channel